MIIVSPHLLALAVARRGGRGYFDFAGKSSSLIFPRDD
jgi:hypothetical protein